jgi:ATP-dependent helicase/nuclease subunit A
MTDWTDAQKEAITQRNKNLLISAGAGSGKTAVLTERIIRLITEDKTDAGRFLVLTFTKRRLPK